MSTAKKLGGLPFEPETEEAMRARFEAALTPRYNVFLATGKDAPSKKRQHVFDFPDLVRMVVSVDHEPNQNQTYLHASFSTGAVIKDTRAWIVQCLERLNAVSNRYLPMPKQTMATTCVMHFFFDALPLGINPQDTA